MMFSIQIDNVLIKAEMKSIENRDEDDDMVCFSDYPYIAFLFENNTVDDIFDFDKEGYRYSGKKIL